METGHSKYNPKYNLDGYPQSKAPYLPKKFGRYWICSGTSSKGRYKPIFHWNERVAQLSISDPHIPEDVMERIKKESQSEEYGPSSDFTRATVSMILRKLKLDKYRERSKSLLKVLNPTVELIDLPGKLLDTMECVYKALETRFFHEKALMPKSLIRSLGKMVLKDRHNIIPFNYLFRKICEGLDPPHREFHEELPLLRSCVKLHALDDIMKELSKYLGLRFERTAVIKRPKIKRRKNIIYL
jgi:hypothetical protein